MSVSISPRSEKPNIEITALPKRSIGDLLKRGFVRLGVLPVFLLAAMIIFSVVSDNFLTTRNLINVARQSTYLVIVSMGQMLALITGGFDLSLGTVVAITSVVSATVMAWSFAAFPDMVALSIGLGILAGFASGVAVGGINGLGIALFNVSPFVMTLGMSSVGFGIALYMTGGVPVYGMPVAFGSIFGFGKFLGIPAPIYVTVVLFAIMTLFLYWTRMGRYLYAIGGNIKAANLSGINTKGNLFMAYVLCSALAAISGLLLTARIDTGEANIGSALPLESIAACVIAGVSLRGGVGRVENVVLGALFIGLTQNGMNLARVESYLQTVVLGTLLIAAVIADQLRQRVGASLQD
jgi:ribose transport system permease protein